MLLKNMESRNKNKIKWQFKVIKKHGRQDKMDYSKVNFEVILDEIVPIKTEVKDKDGNAK